MAARGRAKTSRCSPGAVEFGDPALPVAGTGSLAHVRKSRNSRRRAMVLAAVHALIAVHVTHWLIAGRTASPVEPSESMYTLELGEVNAGFVFLLVVLAGTLVFGRFFCGWACHLVALQDLCAWIMKRLGVRPRPIRSRLLALTPAVVAFYMFAWPALKRALFGGPSFPGFSNHLTTGDFWKTFPGPLFAIATFLVCGFAAVYVLGAKGFCTYGCPYGALFGAMDRLSPGKIVVNDSCEQCGHCTATCTSNVLVHEEVRMYGRVVDPGCMKCMDCVSVCPKNALQWSFSMPSLFTRKPSSAPTVRRYPLTVREELILAAVCLVATLAFRGLYDGPPLLLAVALGGLTAFAALIAWRLLARPGARLQNIALKLSGRMTAAGWLFAALTIFWLAFTGHSAYAQWHRAWGGVHLDRTEAIRADVVSGAFRQRSYSQRHEQSIERAYSHFTKADRWGLLGVTEIKLGLAWCDLLRGNAGSAEGHVRAALALSPERAAIHDDLVDVLMAQGKTGDAIDALREKMNRVPSGPSDRFRLGTLLAAMGRPEQAVMEMAAAVEEAPGSGPARYNLGGLLRRLDRPGEAIVQLREAARLMPSDAATYVELGLALETAEDPGSAAAAIRRAIEIDPSSPEARMHLPGVLRRLEVAAGGPAGDNP